MGEQIKQAVEHNTWFWVLMITSIILIVASWLVPPMSVIDGSVLAAVGELAGFSAIGTVLKAMDRGLNASVRHKDTELMVGDIKKGHEHRYPRYGRMEEMDTADMEGESNE